MRRITFLLVPLLLLACDRQPVAPDITPTFDIGNAPPQTGIVVRADWEVGYYFFDSKTNLTAHVGFDLVDWCAGGSGLFDAWPWADRYLRDRMGSIGQGRDLRATVWEGDFGVDCAGVEGTEPLATGFADINVTYNDVLGTAEHANMAVSVTAHGLLEWAGGGKAVFHGHNKFIGGQGLTSNVTLR